MLSVLATPMACAARPKPSGPGWRCRHPFCGALGLVLHPAPAFFQGERGAMPNAPGRLCSRPGCPGITRGGTCSVCGPVKTRESQRERPEWKNRLYGRRWKRRSRQHLREHPLCVTCKAQGKIVAATAADHIVPHRGDEELFWNGELQSLCKLHHDRKTGRGE